MSEKESEKSKSESEINPSEKPSGNVDGSRRGAMKIAATAIVAGIAAGVGGFVAGQQAVKQPASVPTPEPSEPTSTSTPDGPDVIKVGYTNSLTGGLSVLYVGTRTTIDHWVNTVNSQGGLYLHKYGRRIPIEMTEYDDQSDPAVCQKLYEKLITEDKVDIVLSPLGGYMAYPLIPVMDRYDFSMITGACTAPEKEEEAGDWLYWPPGGSDLYIAWESVDFIKKYKEEAGYDSIAVVNPQQATCQQVADKTIEMLKANGLDVDHYAPYPADATDLTGVVTELKSVNPDALIACTYPSDSFVLQNALLGVDFSPKFLHYFIGPTIPAWTNAYADQLEGVCVYSLYNAGLPPGMYPGGAELHQYFKEHAPDQLPFGTEFDGLIPPLVMQMCQITQECVEAVGEIDHHKIIAYAKNNAHKTMMRTVDSGGKALGVFRTSILSQWQNNKLLNILGPDPYIDYWNPYSPPILIKPPWKK